MLFRPKVVFVLQQSIYVSGIEKVVNNIHVWQVYSLQFKALQDMEMLALSRIGICILCSQLALLINSLRFILGTQEITENDTSILHNFTATRFGKLVRQHLIMFFSHTLMLLKFNFRYQSYTNKCNEFNVTHSLIVTKTHATHLYYQLLQPLLQKRIISYFYMCYKPVVRITTTPATNQNCQLLLHVILTSSTYYYNTCYKPELSAA